MAVRVLTFLTVLVWVTVPRFGQELAGAFAVFVRTSVTVWAALVTVVVRVTVCLAPLGPFTVCVCTRVVVLVFPGWVRVLVRVIVLVGQ